MSSRSCDISGYRWTVAILQLIEAAYQLRSSGKAIRIDQARNFLNIAKLPMEIRNECRAYLGELSIDLNKWRLIECIGRWDRKSKPILMNFTKERVEDDGFILVNKGKLVLELVKNPEAEDILFVPDWRKSSHVHSKMKDKDFAVKSALVLLVPLSKQRVSFIFVGIPFNLSRVLKGLITLRESIAKNRVIEPIVLPQWYIQHIHEKLDHEFRWLNRKFKSFDSDGAGGLDVGPHSLRVAHIGVLMAHKMGFSLADRLRMFAVFLLHDSGKRQLSNVILNKLARRNFIKLGKGEKLALKRHAEYSAAHFLQLFSNQMRTEWMFPILCHHAPRRELKITEVNIQNYLADLGYECHHVYKQAEKKLHSRAIREAMDILRVADCIEDKAVERYHRYQPKDINSNLTLILNGPDKKRFPESIVDVLRGISTDVINLYEQMSWTFPNNPSTLRTFLVNPPT